MQLGMKDRIYSRNYLANERNFRHGPIVSGKFLVFVGQTFCGLILKF
jgi:hypothetical protein